MIDKAASWIYTYKERNMKRIEKNFCALVVFCVAIVCGTIVCGTIGCIGQPFEARQENVGGGYEESFPPGNFPSSASASTGAGGADNCPTPIGTSSSISTGSSVPELPVEGPEIPVEEPEEPEQPQDPKPVEPPPPIPVECKSNVDCSYRNENVCQNFYCVDNKCVEGAADYNETPDQVVGDCHKNICNGLDPYPITVVDDFDRPEDNNVCTRQWCEDGTEVVDSATFEGNDCVTDSSRPGVCKNGACEEVILTCRINRGEATGNVYQCPGLGFTDSQVARIIYGGTECQFAAPEHNGPRCMPGDSCRINIGNYWWDGVCE